MGSSKKSSKHHSKHDDPKDGDCKDCCRICGRLLLFCVAILAVVFSLLVAGSCEFVEFAATNSTTAEQEPNTVVVEFSFGQFRYDANNQGCQKIDDNSNIPEDWTMWTGRISTAVALICAVISCILILVEFICCRFKFSRCLMVTLFSIGILGMALAFLLFASDVW